MPKPCPGQAGSGGGGGPSAPPEPPPPNQAGSGSAPAEGVQAKLHAWFPKYGPKATAQYIRWRASRSYGYMSAGWARRRPIAFFTLLAYGGVQYWAYTRQTMLRDHIHDKTYLHWKIHEGSIVESRGRTSALSAFFLGSPHSGEDPPRVMELFEVLRALKWAERDDRIAGLFADFSSLHVPSSVHPEPLGLAQIEELVQAIHEFRLAKRERFGDKARPTIAWSDTFDSQGQYLLASAFDEVWTQPTGTVPLVGLSSSLPFYKRLLSWLGVKMHAEARKEYKSMVSPFTEEESLPEPQRKNQAELLGELNKGMMYAIGVNRFPDLDADEAADKVEQSSKTGPFNAREAVSLGLLTGTGHKRHLISRLRDGNRGGDPDTKFRTFYSYAKINEVSAEKTLLDDEVVDVGVVYLLGTIGNAPGEFSASSAVRGLKEAGEDDKVSAVILRIDSGGGDVVASESIWDAVKKVQEEHGKPVVASFGNAAASGGYYAAAGADAILACESTITGSIGVASLRPTITKRFFDRIHLSVQSFFTGSTANSLLHELKGEQLERQRKQIDDIYDDFLRKVSEGRKMSYDALESLAGGRVFTGLTAWMLTHKDVGVKIPKATPAWSETLEEVERGQARMESAEGESTWTIVKPSDGGVETKSSAREGKAKESSKETSKKGKKASEVVVPSGSGGGESGDMVVSSPSDQADSRRSSVAPGAVASSSTSASVSSPSESASSDGSTTITKTRSVAPSAVAAAEEEGPPKEVIISDVSVERDEAELEEVTGPYGRGLVDMIGGIWDAALFATDLWIRKEVDRMVTKENMTLEQARENILPGCKRSVQDDGRLVLEADLRLVRYPKQKTVWEVLKGLNEAGDRPDVSIPTYFKALLASWAIRTALHALASGEPSLFGDVTDFADASGLLVGGKTGSGAWIGRHPSSRMRAEMPAWSMR